MNAIEINNVTKIFKGKKGTRVEALKNLTLSIGPGEIFGFLGPNGAGKTTTIKILMDLIKPSSGVAKIMGYDTGSHRSRKQVGYLPENPSFYDYLTAEEYLIFVGKVFAMAESALTRKIEDVLRLLDLWEARKRPMREYSKGMVQRLGLAQVLLHDPDVYILDEPMSGLDPAGRALVKQIILDLKSRGKCVFFSTHITDDVEAVCDRVGIIVRGVLQSVEQVEKILAEGLLGYFLHIKGEENEGSSKLYVPRDEISRVVSEVSAAGREITLIEPKRKNLQDFFLDMLKDKDAK